MNYRFITLAENLVSGLDSAQFASRCPTPADVATLLNELEKHANFQVTSLGHSAQGHEIKSVRVGQGTTRVLLWSQMHGDEPTHTVVLQALLRAIVRYPSHAAIQTLLAGCELVIVPMLNPDGAVMNTRRNAQGIDINRDARVYASPEGRILRDLVLESKAQFAFNLHNQNPRRTVHASGELAAVALLTPPPDDSGDEPPHLIAAQRVASCFYESLPAECRDMVARYGADFMPRAFGEWVQRQGVSTVLVEAGGWPSPNLSGLNRLHFRALLGSLLAIATGEYESVKPDAYRVLPRREGHDRFDLIIRNAQIVWSDDSDSFCGDVGVNSTNGETAGTIVAIGDLSVHSSREDVDAGGMVCSPGRTYVSTSVSPVAMHGAKINESVDWEALLRQGVTTVVGVVGLDTDSIAAWRALDRESRFPMNVAWAARVDEATGAEQILQAVELGAMAIIGDSENANQAAERLGIPLLKEADGLLSLADSDGFTESIKIGGNANVWIRAENADEAEVVVVNGCVAFDRTSKGVQSGIRAGRLLRREYRIA